MLVKLKKSRVTKPCFLFMAMMSTASCWHSGKDIYFGFLKALLRWFRHQNHWIWALDSRWNSLVPWRRTAKEINWNRQENFKNITRYPMTTAWWWQHVKQLNLSFNHLVLFIGIFIPRLRIRLPPPRHFRFMSSLSKSIHGGHPESKSSESL